MRAWLERVELHGPFAALQQQGPEQGPKTQKTLLVSAKPGSTVAEQAFAQRYLEVGGGMGWDGTGVCPTAYQRPPMRPHPVQVMGQSARPRLPCAGLGGSEPPQTAPEADTQVPSHTQAPVKPVASYPP